MITGKLMALLLVFASCVPSAVVGFAFWAMERKIEQRDKREEEERKKRQKEQDDREQKRQENEFITLKCITAALALGEATARAVQRIPDANCNGDMHDALEYAVTVKHEQKEFIERQGIKNIYQTN